MQILPPSNQIKYEGVAPGGQEVWEENDDTVEQEGKSHSNRSCSTYDYFDYYLHGLFSLI
ncbi:hypothetical protein EJB05_02259, partial [Eragrostis curvula]